MDARPDEMDDRKHVNVFARFARCELPLSTTQNTRSAGSGDTDGIMPPRGAGFGSQGFPEHSSAFHEMEADRGHNRRNDGYGRDPDPPIELLLPVTARPGTTPTSLRGLWWKQTRVQVPAGGEA